MSRVPMPAPATTAPAQTHQPAVEPVKGHQHDPETQKALTQFATQTVAALGTLTVILSNLPAILALLQKIAGDLNLGREREG